MITLYGTPDLNSRRCLWMLEEIGEDYTFADVHTTKHAKALQHISPTNQVPVLDDNGFIVSQSLAITFYLAERFQSALYPPTPSLRALAWQWSIWALLHPQRSFRDIIREKTIGDNDQNEINTVLNELLVSLEVLQKHLQDREYIVGKTCTVADINVASSLYMGKNIQFDPADLQQYPAIHDWFVRITSRPTYTAM